jgi:antitoxin component YwqK of YwqJK toxin-antitoxin module
MKQFILPIFILLSQLSMSQQLKTFYYDSGKKASEGILVCNDPTILQANFPANYSKEEQERVYANSVKDGEWKSWYEDGTLQTIEHYNKGLLVGKKLTYHPNGKLESEITFDGVTPSVFYYNTGQKHSEGYFTSDNQTTGLWKGYYESGVINYESQYTNGVNTGITKWFSADGRMYLVQEFSADGTLIKSTKY